MVSDKVEFVKYPMFMELMKVVLMVPCMAKSQLYFAEGPDMVLVALKQRVVIGAHLVWTASDVAT